MSELSEDAEVSNTSRLSMDRGNDGSSNDPITRIEIGSYTTADNSHLLVESGLRLWKPLRETLFTGRACARLDSAWLGTRGTARGDKHFHCRNISNLSDDTHAEDPLAPAGPPGLDDFWRLWTHISPIVLHLVRVFMSVLVTPLRCIVDMLERTRKKI